MLNENFDTERDLTIAQLINKHLNAALSEEEKLDLSSWLNQSPQNRELFESFILAQKVDRKSPLDRYDTAIAITAISENIKRANRKRIIRRWVAAAAFIPIILIAAIQLTVENRSTKSVTPPPTFASADDLLPGNGNVIVRNEDGTAIHIANNSDTSFQVGYTLLKEQNGTVSLSPTSIERVEYHTIETNRGANHKVVLSDGSVVWLNASSSIRFPSQFEGVERRVQVNGEAFFEVEHDPLRPFIVEKDSVSIEVLGTTFNVNGYTKGKTITTLVNGSVKVKHKLTYKVLSPGQSGTVKNNKIDISLADIEEVTGWKNGAFVKHHSDLKSIMNEVSQWYDVDIIYEPGFDNTYNMNIDVSKKVPLSKLLNMIALSTSNKITFREGRVFVSKIK